MNNFSFILSRIQDRSSNLTQMGKVLFFKEFNEVFFHTRFIFETFLVVDKKRQYYVCSCVLVIFRPQTILKAKQTFKESFLCGINPQKSSWGFDYLRPRVSEVSIIQTSKVKKNHLLRDFFRVTYYVQFKFLKKVKRF